MNHIQQPVVRPNKPASFRQHYYGITLCSNAGVNHSEKHTAGWKAGHERSQQMRACMRIEIRHFMQQIDDLMCGRQFDQSRFKLTHIGITRSKISEENNHMPYPWW